MASIYGLGKADIQKRFSDKRLLQLTDDTNSGVINDATIDAMIADAESEFHLYAAKYYVTPISPVPEGLTKKLVDMACLNLMARRPDSIRGDSDEGRFWEKRRASIENWLNGLASVDRTFVLTGATERTTSTASVGTPKVTSETARFSADRMKGFFE